MVIPISKHIRRGGLLSGSDGQRIQATFKYERLPLFCHFCGLLGHDLKHCACYFAFTKKGEEVTCQYGSGEKQAVADLGYCLCEIKITHTSRGVTRKRGRKIDIL